MSEPVHIAALRPRQAAGLADETLEELNRLWAVVRAFSTTAHDVNNALQVIAGNAELLEARDLDPAVRRRVETIRTESGKAAATLNRLLDFARAPRQPVQRLDLWPLIEASVSMRLASLGRGRVLLTVHRDGVKAAWIQGEAVKVHQALINLLLAAEDRVSGRRSARIEVGLTGDVRWTDVRVAFSCDAGGEAAADTDDTLRVPTGLTKDAQLWAVSHLAALNRGALTIDGDSFVVRWPSAD